MFKSFMSKMMALACVMFLMASISPVTVSANDDIAAFTFLGVDRTAITAGQNINFTIRTVGAAFVFAEVGGTRVPGVMQGGDVATRQASWNLTVNPTATQNVIIYANTVNAVEGAASVSIPITVQGAGVAQQPVPPSPVQPPQGQARHRIYSITETPAPRAESVTLSIVTDAGSGYVWISPEANRYIRASRVSQSGNQSTWEVTYTPRQFGRHQVTVSANAAYVLDQFVVSETFAVELAAPYVPTARAAINRANANPSTVGSGDRTTITVTTNLDVEFVWAEVDGRRVNARGVRGSATTRTWELDVRPDRTQQVRVFANTTDSTSGAATSDVRITVRDETARIIRATAQRNVIDQGEWTTIEVRTNTDVENVWAMVDGQRVNARRGSTASGNREREWTIEVRPNRLGNNSIRIYASTTNHERDADTTTVNIRVDDWWDRRQ